MQKCRLGGGVANFPGLGSGSGGSQVVPTEDAQIIVAGNTEDPEALCVCEVLREMGHEDDVMNAFLLEKYDFDLCKVNARERLVHDCSHAGCR